MHEDGLPKREACRELFGLRAEGLALLRRIDPMQTDGPRAPGVEDRKRVAVCDADHPALELLGFDRAHQSESQEQDEPRADDPVFRVRDSHAPSRLPLGTGCVSRETAVWARRIGDMAQLRSGLGLARQEPGAALDHFPIRHCR